MPIDSLWIYIAVPAVVVSTLVLIKLVQRKAGQSAVEGKPKVKVAQQMQVLPKDAGHGDNASKVEKMRSESPDNPKPENCAHHLGYLYIKKAPNQTPIPSECYNCARLLKCLYSPNVIEKVYGK